MKPHNRIKQRAGLKRSPVRPEGNNLQREGAIVWHDYLAVAVVIAVTAILVYFSQN